MAPSPKKRKNAVAKPAVTTRSPAGKKNERITEDIVRTHFKGDADFSTIILEEQQSQHPRIDKLLQNASKKGLGAGMPDFIISFPALPDFVMVVECKADRSRHESEGGKKYADYAVDGVLLYSAYLSKEFDVLAVAVSGQDKNDIKISHYLQKKSKTPELIFGKRLLPIGDYVGGYRQDEQKRSEKYEDLLGYSRILNTRLHKLKIKEDKRSLLLSGVLIALDEKGFYSTYSDLDGRQLANFLVQTIAHQFRSAKIQGDKLQNLEENYAFIRSHNSLRGKGELKNLIDDIDNNVNGFARTYKYYDVLGQFYIEFLRYSNSDRGLGIVLTPPHITEFFSEVADVKPTDIVFDNCAGTGGFLVTAMKKMIEKADGDTSAEKRIKRKQLFGVEYQPEIYPLAVSNMFLHDDGKSNIQNGDCFDRATIAEIQRQKPTVGMLNPPYKAESNDTEELAFVLNNLECLQKHGRCVAIVPMSCMLAQSGKRLLLKEEILEKHTLKAVFSMPDELFFNSKVGVVTAIMVLEANVPHPDKTPTFFGYFKDDGFEKRKAKGRFDYHQKWDGTKNLWLDLYFANRERAGVSIVRKMSAKDEWCAEAYMETDYSTLSKDDFIKALLQYSSFLFLCQKRMTVSSKAFMETNIAIRKTRKWRSFYFVDLFDITKGERLTKPNRTPGSIPLVVASGENNGVVDFIDEYAHSEKKLNENKITIDMFFHAFYQRGKFFSDDNVHVLSMKNKERENPYTCLFIVAVLNFNQYKYAYGRQTRMGRLGKETIKLPVDINRRPDWRFMEDYIKSLPYSSNL